MAKALPTVGEMNRQIVLQSMSSTPSGITVAETFATVATVWAKHIPVSGITQLDTKSINQAITDRFTIRYRTDIKADNWISYNGNSYRIRTVEDINGARRFLELLTERQ